MSRRRSASRSAPKSASRKSDLESLLDHLADDDTESLIRRTFLDGVAIVFPADLHYVAEYAALGKPMAQHHKHILDDALARLASDVPPD